MPQIRKPRWLGATWLHPCAANDSAQDTDGEGEEYRTTLFSPNRATALQYAMPTAVGTVHQLSVPSVSTATPQAYTAMSRAHHVLSRAFHSACAGHASIHELAPRLVSQRPQQVCWQMSACESAQSGMAFVAPSEPHRTRIELPFICNRRKFRTIATTSSEVAFEGQGMGLMHHVFLSTATR